MSSQLQSHELFNDAWLTSYFDPNLLAKAITVAVAGTVKSRNFKNVTTTVGDFLHKFSRHEEGTKDGLIMMPGAIKGTRRLASEILSKPVMLFDIDGGQSFEDINRTLIERGLAYFMYSSYSHGKSTTICRLDHVIGTLGLKSDSTITKEIVKRYLNEVKSYASEIVESVHDFEIVQASDSSEVCIRHAPMDKFRVGLFLHQPFCPSEHGDIGAAQASWEGYQLAVASSLGLHHDHACHNLPHGYYFPRHRPGARFAIRMGGGRMLNLDDFTPEPVGRSHRINPHPRTHRSNTTVSSASVSDDIRTFIERKIRRIGNDLDLVELIVNRLGWETRAFPTEAKASILCPNDDAHSNPGDPDDTGCVVMNPEIARESRGVITCRHEHCQHLRTADFLSMIFSQIELEGAV